MSEIQSQDSVQQSQATGQEGQASQPVSNFTIPDSYKDRGWAEKIKSTDDLFKAYDNAQTLIGKRPAGIPSNDASDAEWDSFYKAMGRPDEPKYELKDPEGLPEGFDTSSFKEQASQILHKAGLTPKQAEKVYQEYLKLELDGAGKLQAESVEKQKALDDEFDKLTKEHFGDDYTKYQDATIAAFDKYSPQSLKGALAEIQDSPKALAAIVSTVKGMQAEIDRVKKEYGAEGSITSGTQTQGQSIEETRRELAALRTSTEARDFTSPKHAETQERIKQLQEAVQRYYKS